jgi:hypothetical protein
LIIPAIINNYLYSDLEIEVKIYFTRYSDTDVRWGSFLLEGFTAEFINLK